METCNLMKVRMQNESCIIQGAISCKGDSKVADAWYFHNMEKLLEVSLFHVTSVHNLKTLYGQQDNQMSRKINKKQIK